MFYDVSNMGKTVFKYVCHFRRRLSNFEAEPKAKLQGNWETIFPNLEVSRLHEITSYRM